MRRIFDGETQQKETETIKPRQFSLNLSNADVERIFEKTGAFNITVEELLENFIGDLVSGTYSNGSDERMCAENWFERFGFSWMYEKTFLTYILQYDSLDYVIGTYEDIQTFKEELQYSKEKPTKFTKEEIEDLKNDLEDSQEQLNSIYSDFKEWAKCDVKSLEEEMKEVFEWIKKRDEKLNQNYEEGEIMTRVEYEVKINRKGKEVILKVGNKKYTEKWTFENGSSYWKNPIADQLEKEKYTYRFIQLFTMLDEDICAADEIIELMEEQLEDC